MNEDYFNDFLPGVQAEQSYNVQNSLDFEFNDIDNYLNASEDLAF
jgi:hypothetical protein